MSAVHEKSGFRIDLTQKGEDHSVQGRFFTIALVLAAYADESKNSQKDNRGPLRICLGGFAGFVKENAAAISNELQSDESLRGRLSKILELLDKTRNRDIGEKITKALNL